MSCALYIWDSIYKIIKRVDVKAIYFLLSLPYIDEVSVISHASLHYRFPCYLIQQFLGHCSWEPRECNENLRMCKKRNEEINIWHNIER